MLRTVFAAHSLAADPSAIVEGPNVTIMYHITVPAEGLEVQEVRQFVQGQRQLLPSLERVVTGMKSGEEEAVDFPPEQSFSPYDANKKKPFPKDNLRAGTKERDVLEDLAGNQATVAQLSDSFAVMDYNHPLAGKPISVQIKILRVDDLS